MTRWIKQKYEGAVAFLFIIISTFLPWTISHVTTKQISAIHARWWFGQFYFLNTQLRGFDFLTRAIQKQQGTTIYPAHLLWGVVSIVFFVTFLLGIALFFREETVTDRLPIHLVAGTLLFITGIGYIITSVWMSMTGIPGLYVPAGAVITSAFGGFLLTNRVEHPRDVIIRVKAVLG